MPNYLSQLCYISKVRIVMIFWLGQVGLKRYMREIKLVVTAWLGQLGQVKQVSQDRLISYYIYIFTELISLGEVPQLGPSKEGPTKKWLPMTAFDTHFLSQNLFLLSYGNFRFGKKILKNFKKFKARPIFRILLIFFLDAH